MDQTVKVRTKLAGAARDSVNGQTILISGRKLASSRECTRDQTWDLYRMQIFDHNKKQLLTLLAGKGGGDAAQMQAPLELHGQEEEELAHLLKECSVGGSFGFACNQIHVGFPLMTSLCIRI